LPWFRCTLKCRSDHLHRDRSSTSCVLLCTHHCVASCERFSDCPPLLSAHFLTPATRTCQAARGALVERKLRNRPATGNQALQDRGSTFRESQNAVGSGPGRAPDLTGAADVAAALRRVRRYRPGEERDHPPVLSTANPEALCPGGAIHRRTRGARGRCWQ
jgi:hypothetical protein